MRASELIARLQAISEEVGEDLEVCLVHQAGDLFGIDFFPMADIIQYPVGDEEKAPEVTVVAIMNHHLMDDFDDEDGQKPKLKIVK